MLLGLSGFELMWHYGRGFGYGVGPEFWLFYMLLSFACFTYGQWRWVEPRLSISNATTYVVIYCTQFGFWAWFSEATNFYPSLLLFDEHIGPNPHSVGFFIFKSTVLMLPLILIDRGKEK